MPETLDRGNGRYLCEVRVQQGAERNARKDGYTNDGLENVGLVSLKLRTSTLAFLLKSGTDDFATGTTSFDAGHEWTLV